MALELKNIKASPITFTHRIVEGFREPAWMKYYLMRDVLAGDLIPTGYGIAWRCWDKEAYVIMPIPLNIFTSWFRALWYAGMHGYTLDALAKAEEAGYQLGKIHGREQVDKEIERRVRALIQMKEGEIRLSERIRVYKELELSLDPKSPTYWRKDDSN